MPSSLAFRVTTSLSAAMTMMFALFICERTERGIDHTIDRLVERELLNRFEAKDPNIMPFLAAVQSANEAALQAIGTTLQRQIEELDSRIRCSDPVLGRMLQMVIATNPIGYGLPTKAWLKRRFISIARPWQPVRVPAGGLDPYPRLAEPA
jgi:hypothetical protein